MGKTADFSKIKRITVINLILVLLLSAGLVSSHFNSDIIADVTQKLPENISYIYVSDTYEDIVATDESENKYTSITSNNGGAQKIVRIRTSEQSAALFSFSIGIAIMIFAAFFAAANSSQCCLNIITTIHKKDGKK